MTLLSDQAKIRFPRLAAFFFLALLSVALAPSFAKAQTPNSADETFTIESADYMRNERESGITTLKGAVSFTYRDQSVSADEVVLDEKNKTAVARRVTNMSGPDGDLSGESLFYDYDKEWFELVNGSGSTTAADVQGKVYFSGRRINGTQKKLKVYGARFTTCGPDCKPEYHLQARYAVIYPDDKVIARDAYFYTGDVKLLYFPVFVASLKRERHYMPEFGYSKIEGFYVYANYPYIAKRFIAGWLLLDIMTKKGFRYGAEHEYSSKKLGGDGYTLFKTNREKDTGASTNLAKITQKLKFGDKNTGDFSFNRTSTYNEFLSNSRTNRNDLSLNLTRQVYEMKAGGAAPTQGASRKTSSIMVTKNSSQSSYYETNYTSVTLNQNLTLKPKLNTQYTYQYTDDGGTARPDNVNGKFKFDTTYTGSLYTLAVSAQRTYDIDGDENTTNNAEELNVLWPRMNLSLQPKLYSKFIPEKLFTLSQVQISNERIRQGPRNNSEALRRNTVSAQASRDFFRGSKKARASMSQQYTQYFYSTKDAEYIFTHNSTLNYNVTRAAGFRFSFDSQKDSGGSPYKYKPQREYIRLMNSFTISKPGTGFTMSTQYDYRQATDRKYSPLTFRYNREMSQNSQLTLGGSRDLNNDKWGPTNTTVNMKRKNTALTIGALWDTEKLDLVNATAKAGFTRKNGWKIQVQSTYEHQSKYSFIRDVIATKTRCCTELELKYDTMNDEFQFHYLILAFPSKKFGFSQSSQGFEIDESAWSSETQSGSRLEGK